MITRLMIAMLLWMAVVVTVSAWAFGPPGKNVLGALAWMVWGVIAGALLTLVAKEP